MAGRLTTAGRKKRKRQTSSHTAYTLFVHENFELIKKDNPELASKDIISALARQWAGTSEDEKQIWKYRAEQTRHEPYPTNPGLMPDVPDTDDELDDDDETDEDTGGGKRRATTRREPLPPSTTV